MLRPSNHASTDLLPVDTRIEVFVNEPADGDVVTSDQVKPMAHLRRGFWIVGRADNTLDRVGQNDVGHLVAGEECTGQSSAVGGDQQDFL